MATKKQPASIFEVEGSEPQLPKLPTLMQFIKANANVITSDSIFPVEIIWTPGNWDNYTIQTDKFRASISERNPLYPLLNRFIGGIPEYPNQVGIQITDSESGSVRFVECGTYGKWKPLGNAGFKFEPVG